MVKLGLYLRTRRHRGYCSYTKNSGIAHSIAWRNCRRRMKGKDANLSNISVWIAHPDISDVECIAYYRCCCTGKLESGSRLADGQRQQKLWRWPLVQANGLFVLGLVESGLPSRPLLGAGKDQRQVVNGVSGSWREQLAVATGLAIWMQILIWQRFGERNRLFEMLNYANAHGN